MFLLEGACLRTVWGLMKIYLNRSLCTYPWWLLGGSQLDWQMGLSGKRNKLLCLCFPWIYPQTIVLPPSSKVLPFAVVVIYTLFLDFGLHLVMLRACSWLWAQGLLLAAQQTICDVVDWTQVSYGQGNPLYCCDSSQSSKVLMLTKVSLPLQIELNRCYYGIPDRVGGILVISQ